MSRATGLLQLLPLSKRVVLGVKVTPGNVHDSQAFEDVLEDAARLVRLQKRLQRMQATRRQLFAKRCKNERFVLYCPIPVHKRKKASLKSMNTCTMITITVTYVQQIGTVLRNNEP
ncbi:hypothetical protein DOE73_01530 [Paenibacillus dendritiformis]|nr:hypothetical protein DOE73_01530 [Paenibacillus dendritiformis]